MCRNEIFALLYTIDSMLYILCFNIQTDFNNNYLQGRYRLFVANTL